MVEYITEIQSSFSISVHFKLVFFLHRELRLVNVDGTDCVEDAKEGVPVLCLVFLSDGRPEENTFFKS